MPEIFSTIAVIIVMLVILIAAYWTSKFVAQKSAKLTRGKYLRVLDRLIVSNDKWIMIVQAGERYFLVGVTKEKIDLISEVKLSDLKSIETEDKDNSIYTNIKSIFSGNRNETVKYSQNNGFDIEDLNKRLKQKLNKFHDILSHTNRGNFQ